jgi:hypothetical protein
MPASRPKYDIEVLATTRLFPYLELPKGDF